jgi:hypothetical protein
METTPQTGVRINLRSYFTHNLDLLLEPFGEEVSEFEKGIQRAKREDFPQMILSLIRIKSIAAISVKLHEDYGNLNKERTYEDFLYELYYFRGQSSKFVKFSKK